MATSHRSKFSTIASAAALAVALGMSATDASALALGRLTVLSALGEPLRAEIDIPELNAAEAESLRTAIAEPKAYQAAGLEYNVALSGLRLTLEQRPNGRSVLVIHGSRPINEPFLDLVLEANWASGQTVRNYTLLLDPPAQPKGKRPEATDNTVTAPMISGQGTPGAGLPPVQQRPEKITAPVQEEHASSADDNSPARKKSTKSTHKQATPGHQDQGGSASDTVTVQKGDTAGRIASANKPANVSLDQMLVALMQSNPKAFINGNVNRMRAGAVLTIPDESQVAAIPANQARQQIQAQSRDFNAFRRNLARISPEVPVEGSTGVASGKVDTQVDVKKRSSDKPELILDKAGKKGARANIEEQIVKDRTKQEQVNRLAELENNRKALENIAGNAPQPVVPPITTSTTEGSAEATSTTPVPGVPVNAASEPTATPSVPPPAETASAPLEATPPTEAVSEPVAPPPPPPVPQPKPQQPPPPPPPEPTFLESLTENPLLLVLGLGGIAGLVGGLVFYLRSRKAKQETNGLDSSFMESRLQPDSFFGSTGGQRVDTSSNNANSRMGGASLNYTHSQLDAGGDVDPLAEADVYLAYGRDMQAEEILKEAQRTNPTRLAIHTKLLEIYAKRQDTTSFQTVFADLQRLSGGSGLEWERACQLGREADPSNPAYQSKGKAASAAPSMSAGLATAAVATAAVAAAAPVVAAPPPPSSNFGDLDLDLDLDLDTSASVAPPPVAAAPQVELTSAPSQWTSDTQRQALGGSEKPASGTLDLSASAGDLEFTLDHGFDQAATVPASLKTAEPSSFASSTAELSLQKDSLMPQFDMGNDSPDEALATKIALAKEFSTIGDVEGARTLYAEVIAKAQGSQKAEAQRLLSALG